MSRGDRCIDASRDRPPAGREGCRGDCAAGGAAAAPTSAASRSTSAPPAKRARRLDQRRAPTLAGPASTRARDRARHGREERTDEEQGADGAEAAHPAVERAVRRVEEPGLVEVGGDPERAAAAGEAPALAAGGEHLPQRQRAPGASDTSVRWSYRAPAKQAVGSGTRTSAPPSATRATVVAHSRPRERKTRVGPWEETKARAPGPTVMSRSSRSPSTSPPPRVLV